MKKQVSEVTSRESSSSDRETVESNSAETESFNMPYIPWAWPDDARASLEGKLK
jgi:hypothetical protein